MRLDTLVEFYLKSATRSPMRFDYAGRIGREVRRLGYAVICRDGFIRATREGHAAFRAHHEAHRRRLVDVNGYHPTSDELAFLERSIAHGGPFEFSPTIRHLAGHGVFDYRRSDERWHLTSYGRELYELRAAQHAEGRATRC